MLVIVYTLFITFLNINTCILINIISTRVIYNLFTNFILIRNIVLYLKISELIFFFYNKKFSNNFTLE